MFFIGAFLLAVQTMAQQITVTGKITSTDDGLPIPGVTIKIKGTSTAVQSGTDGAYSIKANKGDILQFSFLSFTTQERTVGTSTVINMTLTPIDKGLDEIVIVGYGTQKKSNLTGAVSTIDVKKTLEGRPIADVGRALQGSSPGLSIVIPSGEVGSDPIIKIRGQIGSISGESTP